MGLTSRQPCAKCGRPSYGVLAGTPRCFPHMNDRRLSPSQKQRLRLEELEKLGKIDVGMPTSEGLSAVAIEHMNAAREHAWGVKQLDPNPARRIGLER